MFTWLIRTIHSTVVEMKLNLAFKLCLIFVPLPLLGQLFGLSPVFIFITACMGIIPLAALMGKATESLSEHVGVGLSGLVNATFGNACELILALVALRAGLIEVVKASITGSIIGNILLVLGGSMLVGGLKHKKQTFNRHHATTAATLLALAAISLTVPAVFHYSHAAQLSSLANSVNGQSFQKQEIKLALAIAAVQLVTYFLGLVYNLQSQPKLKHAEQSSSARPADKPKRSLVWRQIGKPLFVLSISALLVAILSEYLVQTLTAAAQTLGLNKIFIGVILVAIIGNAAEHSTALLMAWKNNMDLAMNIALSSGTQIALFVAPIIIFVGALIGQPIDLRFNELELLSIIVSVIILAFVATDGECNWLEGMQLLAVYVILGAGFYFAG